ALALALLLTMLMMFVASAGTDGTGDQGLKCGRHEELKDGGIDCATCENALCVLCAEIEGPRCFCRQGYIRRRTGGRCITTTQCPRTCNSCSINQREDCELD
ncbi:hypothetical protein BGZ74_002800, partial [Mortierella antarctica]